MIYLDHAATTAVYPQVVEQMTPYFSQQFFNPSAGYEGGSSNKKKLEEVRENIAKSIGADAEEIYFTAGGTESDNWALVGLAEQYRSRGNHIITTQIEHHAVLNTCRYLEQRGYEVTYLPVTPEGLVEEEEVRRAIRKDTIGISVMYANNEIGTLQPIQEIGMLAADAGIPFHTDAVQAYGHLPIDVRKEHITMLSASGHKFGGPKGIGFLYLNRDCALPSFLHGGGQEKGKRAGTENVPGIIGMGEAALCSYRKQAQKNLKIRHLRDYLMAKILSGIPGVHLNGCIRSRLPGNLNLCFEGIEAQTLLVMMEMKGIYMAGGSACTTGSHEPSHVLTALGLPEPKARASVRITLGEENTEEEMDTVYWELEKSVGELRGMQQNNHEITL